MLRQVWRERLMTAVTSIHEEFFDLGKYGGPLGDHFCCPGLVTDICSGHPEKVGQPLAIDRNMLLDPRCLLASVISFAFRWLRVFHALSIVNQHR
jgi:hypothetical protein